MNNEQRLNHNASTLTLIGDAFSDAKKPGLPKIAQLADAILNLISSGCLKQEDKLPGEREICASLNISLGTVQRSLNQLMTSGELVREHGRGTFVRQTRRAMHELWHYRFRDKTSGELLPVYSTIIGRSTVARNDILHAKLGSSRSGYIRISRLIKVNESFRCWSDMYLSADRFQELAESPISELESVNLKQVLNNRFNVPTLSIDQTVLIKDAPEDIADQMLIASGTHCLFLQIVGLSRHNEPVSFQQIYIPPVDFELELNRTPDKTT